MKLSGWRLTLVRILSLVAVIAISVLLFLNRDKVGKLESLGIPGIFLLSIISNATLILPVPGLLFTSLWGTIFNPLAVGIAAGAGSTIGELTGYLAGFSGQGVIENRKWFDRVEMWMKKYGGWTILVLAIIPNPLFDIAGMVAGALKMPIWEFLACSFIGKSIKMIFFAYGGFSLLKWIGL
jgi:membrane protein YqaA with SNARE-associated domain